MTISGHVPPSKKEDAEVEEAEVILNQKYDAERKSNKKPKAPTKLSWFKKWAERCRQIKAVDLSWCQRALIYFGFILIAVFLLSLDCHKWLAEWLICDNSATTGKSCETKGNVVNPNLIAGTFLFVFITSIAAWIIRTFDKKKELHNSLLVRTDALLTEFAKFALSGKGLKERIQGVLGLVQLKQEYPIYKVRVDGVTSSIELPQANLAYANLAHADLTEANLDGANLSGADLTGATLDKIHPNVGEDALIRTNLSKSILRGASLIGANLRGSDLTEADLRETTLIEARLSQARLIGANLEGSWLNKADLKGSILRQADLSDADLTEANLSKANLSGANLSKAKLEKTDFSEADLSGADIRGVDLTDVRLGGADLRSATLNNATGLMEAELVDAIYNNETRFPDGFNPQEKAMKYDPD